MSAANVPSMSWERRYPAARLVAYDAAWKETYAALAHRLIERLGAEWEVEHVGSTSVPGLVAKPVIDLALRIPAGRSVGWASQRLQAAGWTEAIPIGAHHASFLLADGVRQAIAHLFSTEEWPCAHVRLFSDWLRRHPSDRDAYAALKQGLVADDVWGSDYTAAKRAFVQEVVNRARSEVGLAAVELPQ